MTEQKYSIDEIKQAIDAVAGAGYGASDKYVSRVIAELTRPPIEFAEGEVYYCEAAAGWVGAGYYIWSDHQNQKYSPLRRKQTTVEAGATELVEAIECWANSDGAEKLQLLDALDKWKRERSE